MTAPTAPTVLSLYRDMAVQNQRIVELGQAIARHVSSNPPNAQAVGLALVGAGANVLAELSNRSGSLIASMLEVPDTEADMVRLLSVQRDAAAAAIRELVVLFSRFGWDLP